MATNPMQRKARISFMLGMLVTLLLSAIILVFIFLQYKKTREELESINSQKKENVWVFNQDVSYGEEITPNMLEQRTIYTQSLPTDYTSLDTVDGTPLAKTDIKANTILVSGLIQLKEQNNSEREQTYSVITLPIDLETGDYVDIRIRFSNGQDYIVLSKKMAEIPAVNGEYLADSVKLKLSEAELLAMSGAIVEAASVNGGEVYAIKYTEASSQKAAEETYMPSQDIIDIIYNNPNAVDDASYELKERWSKNQEVNDNRSKIELEVSQGNEEGAVQKAQEEIESKKAAREEYLSTLVAPIQ